MVPPVLNPVVLILYQPGSQAELPPLVFRGKEEDFLREHVHRDPEGPLSLVVVGHWGLP